MDTKLKKLNDNMAVKVVAFVLCSLLFTLSLTMSAYLINELNSNEYNGEIFDVFNKKGFQESDSFRICNGEIIQNLVPLGFMKNKKHIKSDKSLSEERIARIEEQFFYQGSYDISNDYSSWVVEANPNGPTAETYIYGPATIEMFRNANKEELENIMENVIKSEINHELSSYKMHINHLNSISGLSYYISDGKNYVTNLSENSQLLEEGAKSVKEGFKKNPTYIFYDNGVITGVNDGYKNKDYANSMKREIDAQPVPESESLENYKIYYTFDKSFFEEQNKSMAELKSLVEKVFPIFIVSLIATLILFIYLLVTTGRKNNEGNRKLYKPDKIFVEIQIFAIFAIGCMGLVVFESMVTQYGSNYGVISTADLGELILHAVVVFPLSMVALWFVLSLVRNIKAGYFWKRSCICRCASAILECLKPIFNGGTVMRKVVLVSLAICLLSATMFLAPVVFILILVFAPKIISKYEAAKKGIHEVKSGNLSYKIPVEGNGEFDRLARDINEISDASSLAIENELKNQRLKTDLISNVSHDLKTPLTSIITYIDLLKQEGLDCEEAPKYLDILDQKAARLKNLTEDLFEAAKASSGDIPVNLEKVDLMAVINQSLGEFSDRIEKVKLEIRVTSEQEKNYVNADRQLLWRVIENLLGNVVKYAQEGSRVYIDIKPLKSNTKKNMLVLEMKNISKTELNIHADELMERFKRGDESRTTEGSGLGLAIAKDLVSLQNGWFELKIDGDLFKAVVLLEEAHL